MNRRATVSAALSLGALMACSGAGAQAPTPAQPHPQPLPPGVQSKIDGLQAQIDGLQAEVKRLKAGQAQRLPDWSSVAPAASAPYLYFYPEPLRAKPLQALPLQGLPQYKSLLVPDGNAPQVLMFLPSSGARTPYLDVAPTPQRRFTNIPPTRIIPLGQIATGGASVAQTR